MICPILTQRVLFQYDSIHDDCLDHHLSSSAAPPLLPLLPQGYLVRRSWATSCLCMSYTMSTPLTSPTCAHSTPSAGMSSSAGRTRLSRIPMYCSPEPAPGEPRPTATLGDTSTASNRCVGFDRWVIYILLSATTPLLTSALICNLANQIKVQVPRSSVLGSDICIGAGTSLGEEVFLGKKSCL